MHSSRDLDRGVEQNSGQLDEIVAGTNVDIGSVFLAILMIYPPILIFEETYLETARKCHLLAPITSRRRSDKDNPEIKMKQLKITTGSKLTFEQNRWETLEQSTSVIRQAGNAVVQGVPLII